MVIRWKSGLPTKRDEPWLLMTNLVGTAVLLTDLYGRRRAIAELFRDGKDGGYGLSLGQTQATTTGRLDRRILILTLATLLLIGRARLVPILSVQVAGASVVSSSSRTGGGVFRAM